MNERRIQEVYPSQKCNGISIFKGFDQTHIFYTFKLHTPRLCKNRTKKHRFL